MSSCWLAVLLAMLAQAPSGEVAQDTLVARVERLLPQWRQAVEVAARADALREQSREVAALANVDTVRVGPLRVLASPEDTASARSLFEATWKEFAPLVGDSIRGLAAAIFVFHGSPGAAEIYVRQDRVYRLTPPPWGAGRRISEHVRAAIGQALADALPDDVRQWIGGSPLIQLRGPAAVYRELATAPSRAARSCFVGVGGWCWEALGISQAGDPWRTWYTAPERRLVATRLPSFGSPRTAQALQCFAGSLQACDALLFERAPPIPLSATARTSLVVYALQAGGEGSYARLLATASPSLPERLALAAGRDRDALVAAWRADVLSRRPDAAADLARLPWSVLFWMLVLGGLAVRGSRWRSV